jgi:hypothetical protein
MPSPEQIVDATAGAIALDDAAMKSNDAKVLPQNRFATPTGDEGESPLPL